MAEFKEGQRVHVEFDGVVDCTWSDNKTTDVTGSDNLIHSFGPGVKITALDPENWPPQAGDIWATDDYEYAAYRMQDGGLVGLANLDHAEVSVWPERFDWFKTLNPRLVRRRERQ